VAVVELDNPPRNYMTWQMVDGLDEVTRTLEADPSVRAVVLTGAVPGRFVTHFDVREELSLWRSAGPLPDVSPGLARLGAVAGRLWRGLSDSAPPAARALTPLLARFKYARLLLAMERIHGILRRLERMDKGVIAAINGHAIGAGYELALACDFRFMARGDAQVGLSEILLGVLPGAGGVQRLVRLVGMRHARRILLEGRHYPAAEAEALGLVDSLHAPEALLSHCLEHAALLARRSPVAVGRLKRGLLEGGKLEDALKAEQTLVLEHGIPRESLSAMERFVEMLEESGIEEEDVFERFQRGEPVRFGDKP